MTPLSDIERIGHILDRIDRIQYAEIILIELESEDESWEEAQAAFDAICYNLLVIGEAVKSLSDKITKANASIPWSAIVGMRDILAHEYFRVDGTVVRATIDQPLQKLKKLCEKVLSKS